MHGPEDRLALGVEEPAAGVADGPCGEERSSLRRGQPEPVDDCSRSTRRRPPRSRPWRCPRSGRARVPPQWPVPPPASPAPSSIAAPRCVQVPVRRTQLAGQLTDQLLARHEGHHGRQAADQRHELDAARLIYRERVDHRLQRGAPREPQHLAVAQRLVEPLGGEVARRGLRIRRPAGTRRPARAPARTAPAARSPAPSPGTSGRAPGSRRCLAPGQRSACARCSSGWSRARGPRRPATGRRGSTSGRL